MGFWKNFNFRLSKETGDTKGIVNETPAPEINKLTEEPKRKDEREIELEKLSTEQLMAKEFELTRDINQRINLGEPRIAEIVMEEKQQILKITKAILKNRKV